MYGGTVDRLDEDVAMPLERRAGTRLRLAAVALTAVLLTGCGSSSPGGSPVPGATDGAGPSDGATSTSATRTPLVIDTDLGADDMMAITYLATQADYEIKAITVAGTGLVHCLPGETNARDLLNELNRPAVPVACGPEEPLAGGKEFPAEWRTAADDRHGLNLARVSSGPQGDAVTTLIAVLVESPEPVTMLTLGPQTNLAAALHADGRVAGQVARIVAMGGALDVSGNATPEGGPAPAEWNFAADPTAAAEVLASGIPITLVPLDATNDVPLTQAFVDRLREDDAAGPANLVSELVARISYAIDVDSMWDPLAAVALVDASVVEVEELRVAVSAEGAKAGQLVRQPGGAPVSIAVGADAQAFQDRFLSGLRSGGPRKTPMKVRGTIAIAFDGASCISDVGPSIAAGTYDVAFANGTASEAVGVIVRIKDGSSYDDLVSWIADNPGVIDQPPMVDVPGIVFARPGGTASSLIEIPAGTNAVACLIVATGDELAVPGGAFIVE